MTNPMNHIADFISWMDKNGCAPANAGDVIADDVRRYYQLKDDKKGTKKGTYVLNVTDDFAYGFVMNMRTGEKFPYTSKKEKSWTPEQLEAYKIRIAETKALQEAEEAKNRAEAAQRAVEIWTAAAREGNHPYLKKKKIKLHTARITEEGELVIPIAVNGKITSLQTIDREGDKKYLFGGEIKGGYFSLSTQPADLSEIIIVEGFATAATIFEATGKTTVAVFTANNLKAVTQAIHAKYPKASIIIAADNDWKKFEDKKSKYNTGIHYAEQAAASIGGAVVFPCPKLDNVTDFNDIWCMLGEDEVKNLFDALPRPEIESIAVLPDPISHDYAAYFGSEDDDTEIPAHVLEAPLPDVPYINTKERKEREEKEKTAVAEFLEEKFNFKVLGQNNGTYYYFSFGTRQIVTMTSGTHSIQNLLQLDNLQKWRDHFGQGGKVTDSKAALLAQDGMMQIADKRGVFDEKEIVRGAGCWVDKGRIVWHCGDRFYVDCVETALEDLETEYLYVAAPRLVRPAKIPLDEQRAKNLQKICEMVTWENKLSGTLLAGWLVIAPLSASLSWRPHIWLTGEAESGKSTILNKIINPVLGRMALKFDGGSTEPAIRAEMGYGARPLVYDEAEPSPNMFAVVALMRLASGAGVTGKFGQRQTRARFCACLSAINPPVSKTADESRISFLHLRKNRRPSAIKDYADLLDMIETTITDNFAEQMIARTLPYVDVILTNIKTFGRAARRTVGGARASELIGAMMAGVYFLNSKELVSDDMAFRIVNKYKWGDHTIIEQDSDPIKLVQWISGSFIRNRLNQDMTVSELILSVVNHDNSRDESIRLLKNHGIKVENERVYVANVSQNLAKLLKGTDWQNRWARTLYDVEGAEKHPCTYFSPGIKANSVSLPMHLFTQTETPPEEEPLEF